MKVFKIHTLALLLLISLIKAQSSISWGKCGSSGKWYGKWNVKRLSCTFSSTSDLKAPTTVTMVNTNASCVLVRRFCHSLKGMQVPLESQQTDIGTCPAKTCTNFSLSSQVLEEIAFPKMRRANRAKHQKVKIAKRNHHMAI